MKSPRVSSTRERGESGRREEKAPRTAFHTPRNRRKIPMDGAFVANRKQKNDNGKEGRKVRRRADEEERMQQIASLVRVRPGQNTKNPRSLSITAGQPEECLGASSMVGPSRSHHLMRGSQGPQGPPGADGHRALDRRRRGRDDRPQRQLPRPLASTGFL